MSQAKILIADDETEVLGVMQKRIAKEGYRVITAQDGEQAWEKIKSDDPDVILLDLRMPKMDGLTVLKNLRENPPTAKWQPVIIVSAMGEIEDMKKGFDLEADHYITKPCQMEDVIKSIHLMLTLIPARRSKFETQD